MPKRIAMIAVAGSILLAIATPGEAKVWSGLWGGSSPSTLEFLAGGKVKYCFKSSCVVRPYSGDPAKTIRFQWGSASLTFQRTRTGYSGTHRAGGAPSLIDMK